MQNDFYSSSFIEIQLFPRLKRIEKVLTDFKMIVGSDKKTRLTCYVIRIQMTANFETGD